MAQFIVTIPAFKRVEEVHIIEALSEAEAVDKAMVNDPDEWVEDADYYEVEKSGIKVATHEPEPAEEGPNLCPDSDDGKHKPYGVSGPVAGYEELVADVTCLHCGVSGSTTIKNEDVLW